MLAGVILMAHGLALVAAWIAMAGWLLWLVLAAILASLAAALVSAGRQPVALELREDGNASWKDRFGTWHEARLGRNHFVSPVLVVLELAAGTRAPGRVILAADSVEPDGFRSLRVWLRWRGSPGGAEPE
jgi:hypothetical protein